MRGIICGHCIYLKSSSIEIETVSSKEYNTHIPLTQLDELIFTQKYCVTMQCIQHFPTEINEEKTLCKTRLCIE